MPLVTSDVHVDQALSAVSICYAQDQSRFIASQVFPSVNVSHLSNKYHIFSKDAYLRSEAGLRAPGSRSRTANFQLSTGTYSCEEYSIAMNVDDLVAANADAGLDILTSTTKYVTEQLLLKRDQVFAATAFADNVWTGSTTGGDITPGTLWSASGGTPIKDIQTQQDAVEAKTGRKPGVLVLGSDVYTALRDSDDILDRVKYSERGVLTTDLMASIFGVDRVIVAAPIVNSGAESGTASYGRVFNAKDALLCYVPDAPGLMTPSAGYMFSFTGISGAYEFEGLRTRRYREEAEHSERIEALSAFDFKVTGADLGAWFDGAVA